jgi:hypothetical protein
MACTVHSVEIILQNRPYVHWNIYIKEAQNLLLHVSALHRCHLRIRNNTEIDKLI